VFVLYDGRVDFRRAGQLDQVAQTLQHSVIAPKSIAVDGQRLLIRSATELELLNLGRMKRGESAIIGKALLPQDDAVVNGELLAAWDRARARLSLYDLNQAGQQLQLVALSDVRAPD